MAATSKAMSEQTIADILSKMEDGQNLLQVCRAAGVSYSAVRRRINDSPDLTALYAIARQNYAHAKVDELHIIALSEPDVMRARLRCDCLKWEISKVLPKIYGDKLSVETTINDRPKTREELTAEINALLHLSGMVLVKKADILDVEPKHLEGGNNV